MQLSLAFILILLAFILKFKCSHKYEIIKEGLWEDIREETCGTYYYLRCVKCGNIKYYYRK